MVYNWAMAKKRKSKKRKHQFKGLMAEVAETTVEIQQGIEDAPREKSTVSTAELAPKNTQLRTELIFIFILMIILVAILFFVANYITNNQLQSAIIERISSVLS